jgi:hypothetical protein
MIGVEILPPCYIKVMDMPKKEHKKAHEEKQKMVALMLQGVDDNALLHMWKS